MDVLKLIEELIDVFQHVHWLRLDYQRTQTRVPNQKVFLNSVLLNIFIITFFF